MNTISPRPPMRATTLPPPEVAMPTTRLDTTSGITVMRIAFTNSVPIGSTIAIETRATPPSAAAIANPDDDAGGQREKNFGRERHGAKVRTRR